MKTKLVYSSPEIDWNLFREMEVLCVSGDLEDLVDDTDNIDWIS